MDARREPALARAVRALSQEKYGWGDGLVVELARTHRVTQASPRSLE